MSFYKKKTNNSFRKEDQIKWKNTTHESRFNQFKNYYGIIKIGNQSFVEVYEGKFRSEAKAALEEIARMNHGTLEVFSVLK